MTSLGLPWLNHRLRGAKVIPVVGMLNHSCSSTSISLPTRSGGFPERELQRLLRSTATVWQKFAVSLGAAQLKLLKPRAESKRLDSQRIPQRIPKLDGKFFET